MAQEIVTTRRNRVRWLAAALALVLLAGACGTSDDSDDSDDDSAPAATDAATETAADVADDTSDTDTSDADTGDDVAPAADEPEPPAGRSGTLLWALPSNGANFYDPHASTNPFARSWMYPFYDRLTNVDADGNPQPMLATSWEFSDDGSSLTFHLREGVVFHDGAPFNAEAAKLNLDRARNPQSAPATFVDLLAVESVDVVDEYSVRLNLSAPGGALPMLLGDQAGMMISPTAMDNEDIGTMPVGAGPFVATAFRVDEVMFADAFDDYWDPEIPKVDKLELRFILDPQTRLNAISSGELHGGFMDVVTHSRDDAIELGLVITERVSTGMFQLFLNTELVPEFANVNVRRAMAMAIDQQAFSDALHHGECTPSDQVFSKGWWAANPDIDADYYPYDPAAARALLEAEGITDLEFTSITANLPPFVAMSEAVAGFFAEIGVTMNVAATPIPELIAGFIVNKTAEAYFSVNPGAVDPAKLVGTIWLPPSPFNPGGYEVPGLFPLHLQAQSGTTPEERAGAYHEMAQLLTDEQPTIVFCTPANLMVHRPEVGGVQILATQTDVDVSQIYFVE